MGWFLIYVLTYFYFGPNPLFLTLNTKGKWEFNSLFTFPTTKQQPPLLLLYSLLHLFNFFDWKSRKIYSFLLYAIDRMNTLRLILFFMSCFIYLNTKLLISSSSSVCDCFFPTELIANCGWIDWNYVSLLLKATL
jgi:hypothetical protein